MDPLQAEQNYLLLLSACFFFGLIRQTRTGVLITFPQLGCYGIPKKGSWPEELARQLIHGYYAFITYIDTMTGYEDQKGHGP